MKNNAKSCYSYASSLGAVLFEGEASGILEGVEKFFLKSCKEAETCVIMADFAADAVS